MTEAEWQDWCDPEKMLEYLRGKVSKRKLRLFAAACFRRVWDLLKTDALRQAVHGLERFADGEMDEETFGVAASTTHPMRNYLDEILYGQPRAEVMLAAYGLHAATLPIPEPPYSRALQFIAQAVQSSGDEERAAHVHLIREVFGNPFRPGAVHPAWLLWGDGIIVKLAAAIYDERSLPAGTLDPVRLAVLGDALEEAGCTDSGLLDHLRGPGPHVRGCFVLDALLGRE